MAIRKDGTKMFKSTQNKGFSLTFANGITISVQFGPSNYCEHQERDSSQEILDWLKAPKETKIWKSKDAEFAAWTKDGRWFDFANERFFFNDKNT